MPHTAPDRVRNVALIGHRGTGKTSLAEALLFEAGAINRMGRVEEGSTVCDFEEDEHARGMSISTAIASFEHDGRKINLLDTPGEPSFVADAITALAVVDSAVVVVSGVAGVETHTRRMWQLAGDHAIPRLLYVNMLDRERADFFSALDSLKEAFGPHVVATEIPIGSEQEFEGVIDLIDMKAYTWSGPDRGGAQEVEIPAELAVQAEEYRERMMDEVAENSDELMEHYLEGEEISHEEIVVALKSGVTAGRLFPVTCGAAVHNIGTSRLLDALVEDLPSPAMRGGIEIIDGEGERARLAPGEDGETLAFIFKTRADPYAGRVNLFRVCRGTIRADSQLENPTRGVRERIGQLLVPLGSETTQTAELGPGDIGAVAKLKETRAGDVLAEGETPLRFPALDLPAPVMAFAYEPRTKGDEEKAANALRRLCEEDPTLDVHRDPQTGEQIIAGLTQIHVEVVVERLKERYGATVELHPPRVPYVEAVRGTATAHARHKKQSGGRGQFADCTLEISPAEPGAGLDFVDEIKGGVIPNSFIPAVEKGVREAMAQGTIAGYPVRDVRVRLFDGQYHSVDSSEMAFKIAGSKAFKQAMVAADPVLLEPIMRMTIMVPEEAVGDVMGDLNARRGRPLGMEPRGGLTEISADVPMAEVLDYAAELRSMTGGQGEFSMSFERHEPVPASIAQKVIAAADVGEESHALA